MAGKLSALESEGRLVLARFGSDSSDVAWELSCRNMLQLCFHANSLFVEAFEQATTFATKVDVIASASREFREGFTVENTRLAYLRVVYSDLANGAQSLLDEGFLRCAAVVARVSLERHLRELGRIAGIPDAETKKAGALNQDLWKASVYTKGTWKEIESWLTLSNEAAHAPDFEAKYDKPQVQRVLTGIDSFVKQT